MLEQFTKPVKRAEREIVGREAEVRTLLAAFMRPELCNVILLGEAGSGKGHPNDEVLPVPGGYKKVGDICVGDYVYDENGYPVQVIGVYPQGKKRLYQVEFADGTHVPCNDEHIWNVRSRSQHYKDKPYQNRTLRELIDDGIHKLGSRKDGSVLNKWYIPVNAPLQRDRVDLPIDPYVLGVMIGDGCLTDTVHTLEISSNDENVIAEVAKRIGAIGYEQRKGRYSWIFSCDAEKYGHKWYQRYDFADLSPELDCVFGKYSLDRAIPNIYKIGSIEQRRLLLQGLMDADGCITDGDRLNARYSTKSERLAHDVKELATSLGMRASVISNCRGERGVEYEVYFHLEIDARRDLFFKASNKIAAFDKGRVSRTRKFNRHYDDMAIVDVIDTGEDVEMTCIYVDSPTHLYQVGVNHIVTHNTALVQGAMLKDNKRLYLEVDLARMIANLNDPNEMAAKLKTLFDEAMEYRKNEDQELVLFIDEFHQIVQLSAAAVEALKPLLADSGTRGIRVVAATTYEEFRAFVSSNQALVERLQRINLKQADKELTVRILRDMTVRYGVDHHFYNDSLFELIYEYTNRYIPANAQPRKSILILDAMVGWSRLDNRRLDRHLLAEVIKDTEGVNVNFKVDAKTIKKRLDAKVLAQQYATSVIENRLQICVADLNDKKKPMSTMLFTGSTGVGKLIADYEPVPIYSEGGVYSKPHGDLKVGDYVFSKSGEPEKVLATFQHDNVDMYRVTFADGRTLDAGGNHLWAVYTKKQRNKLIHGGGDIKPKIMTTKEILDSGVDYTYKNSNRSHLKYFIPMNKAVQWPEGRYKLSPYALGLLIGNGSLTQPSLTFSSDDEETTQRLADELGAIDIYDDPHSFNHTFYMPFEMQHGNYKVFQTMDVLSEVPELIGCYSRDRFIPEIYMHGSIEQRMELIRGLFDTDGTVSSDDRVRVSYSTVSKKLAGDVRQLLFSVGISNTIRVNTRTRVENGKLRELTEYIVRVKLQDEAKPNLFKLSRKRECIYANMRDDKSRIKDFTTVGISNIEYIGKQSAQCIYVDDEDHLYQAGQFIVTHNTEMTKQLASILFGDDRNLIRFDMTEFANPDSLERFRDSLTSRVWERPYSIVLLDEIEKACSPVTRILLQVLDDGRLTDRNNREVSFTNCYMILTTNAASEIYANIAQYGVSDTGDDSIIREYDKLIRRSISQTTGDNRFPPELLGRIDCIVPFQPLSENTMRNIVKMRLRKLSDEVSLKHNVKLRIDQKVVDYLVGDKLTTESDSGGARAVVSQLEAEVTTAVATFINANPHVNVVGVKIEGEMVSENKYRLKSGARVIVGPVRR